MIHVSAKDDLNDVFRDARAGDAIIMDPGEYRVKSAIFTEGLNISGAGAGKTVIVWDDYARKPDSEGREYNTFRTWTLAVCADNVTMSGLSVINSALMPEVKGQEVALTVYGNNFRMENCRLSSTQDTLFLGPLPADLIERYDGFLPDWLRAGRPCAQNFKDCLIEGTVDFIFGCGEAQFENCEIRSLYDKRGVGYAAAPAHALSQKEGFRFSRCRFSAGEGVAPGSVYLARPWRDYGLCVFDHCEYGPHISPLGFDKWNGTDRDRTARFYETPPVAGRVSWARR